MDSAIELPAFGLAAPVRELEAPLLPSCDSTPLPTAPCAPASLGFGSNAVPSRAALPASGSLKPPTGSPGLPTGSLRWDSFSYGAWHSVVYDEFMAAKKRWYDRRVTALRWSANFLLGATVAAIAVGITFCSRELADIKFGIMDALIAVDKANGLYALCAFLGLLGVSLLYVAIAAIAVAFVEPAAGGSGIPEIKTVLNGVKLPHVLRLKTLACKVIGNACSVASGLPVGKEGPMIHSGACVAAALTQGRAEGSSQGCSLAGILFCDAIPRSAFRNDKEKSEFISCGAAAGVAAAFGAPIGGLLFTIEEGTTHWFRALVWRIFFCTIIASYVTSLLNSGIAGSWGSLGNPGMFNFGSFDASTTWTASELGAYGGAQGAVFVAINRRLSLWRFDRVPVSSPVKRFFEALVVAAIVCAFTFGFSYAFGSCTPRPSADAAEPYLDDLVSFYCSADEFNELASLFMVSSESAIKQLFHSTKTFSVANLALFYATYTLLSCLTYGIAVPSGLFIPALLSGSALGRLTGEILHMLWPRIDAGTYALIGAAAVLGGATRMTVSLAVILLETTGNYQFGLPLMATLITARFVGNMFNEGIYDLHIDLRGWPLLPEHLPKHVARRLIVRDVMATPPCFVEEVARAGEVLDLLHSTRHNGFPVVYSESILRAYPRVGSLAGLIERKHLAFLILRRAFHTSLPVLASADLSGQLSSDMALPLGSKPAYSLVVEGVQPLGVIRRGGESFSASALGNSTPHVLLSPSPRVKAIQRSAGHAATLTSPRSSRGACAIESGGLDFVAVSDIKELPYPGKLLASHADIELAYPRYPDVDGIELSTEERAMYIDLRPFLNPAPATVHVCTPLETAYATFKGLALRHLLVVNDCGDAAGIVTRHDLILSHVLVCHKRVDGVAGLGASEAV